FLSLTSIFNSECPTIMTCRDTYFVTSDEYNTLVKKLSVDAQILSHTSYSLNRIGERLYARYVDERIPRPLTGNATSVRLDLLDQVRIDAYLESQSVKFAERLGADWRHVKLFLESIYDLSDLMSRPILLAMVVDTLLEGGIRMDDPHQITGPAALYTIYT